ncbi:MAG: OmpA family protein [Oscillospiraceae bacterium]|nr:OmpA family protein [Oscillospiraceae bacterium]
MKICPKCLAILENTAEFCADCGAQLPPQPPQPEPYYPHQSQRSQPEQQHILPYQYQQQNAIAKSKAGLILSVLIPFVLIAAATAVLIFIDPLNNENDPDGIDIAATADPNVQKAPTQGDISVTQEFAYRVGLEEAHVRYFSALEQAIDTIKKELGYKKFDEIVMTSSFFGTSSVLETTLHLQTDDLFETESATLTPTGEKVMRYLSAALGDVVSNIQIAGHTDNVPIQTAEFSSNYDLSYARVLNVADIFYEHMDSRNITVSAYGENEPKTINSTEEGRSENRRIELRIQVIYTQALITSPYQIIGG